MLGYVKSAWNYIPAINPATLSGAIDVIVVEHEDGSLACSPFHVRFGKFSLLQPSEKKVEFRVNNVKQDYSMKLGDGGEAFFVFETAGPIPPNLQTSPLLSPATSPENRPSSSSGSFTAEPEPFDLDNGQPTVLKEKPLARPQPLPLPNRQTHSDYTLANTAILSNVPETALTVGYDGAGVAIAQRAELSDAILTGSAGLTETPTEERQLYIPRVTRSESPPPLPRHEAVTRAMTLSKKLLSSNIQSKVNDDGDVMLDMTGFKTSDQEAKRAALVARRILSEELENLDNLIGVDEDGRMWIYSSAEAKDAASRRVYPGLAAGGAVSADALSDPGYISDDTASQRSIDLNTIRTHRQSDSAVGMSTPPDSPTTSAAGDPSWSFAKTLRLTSDQLKSMNLKPGPNPMSFSVNRATCNANIFLWKCDVPIVISDIDGTITKSDVLGHLMNRIGRDWTHPGVAKLFTDIVSNGYNILYLTSRSVGQADTTRSYIQGIVQDGYKLPAGPVILSPDRTIAALKREVYLRKPEVFKMACLKDIMNLFHQRKSPFYAGFGNRITDAMSYISVNIPATRIFTINSQGDVYLHLVSLSRSKMTYINIADTIDYSFPPVDMLLQESGEKYTDFNTWRDEPMALEDISASESELSGDEDDEDDDSEGDEEDDDDDEAASNDPGGSTYLSRESMDSSINNLRQSLESEGFRGELARYRSDELEIALDDGEDADQLADSLDAMDMVARASTTHRRTSRQSNDTSSGSRRSRES